MTQERYWNTEAWRFNDKDWLSARKQEWKYVQSNLKIIASTEFKDSNYLKAHKEFFFKGTVSDLVYQWAGNDEFGGMLPFFLLWYHPAISVEELDQLKAWACQNVSNAKTMASVREKWDKVWSSDVENYSRNYGFCGGKEKLIAEVFWGKPLIGAEFDQYEWLHSKRFPRNYEGHEESSKRSVGRTMLHFVHGRRVSNIYWRSVGHRVGRPNIARNTLGQYLFDHAMTFDCSEDEKIQSVVSWTATVVLQRHKVPSELLDDEFAVQTLDEVEALYRNGKFSESYQKVWEDVECGKIDRKIG